MLKYLLDTNIVIYTVFSTNWTPAFAGVTN